MSDQITKSRQVKCPQCGHLTFYTTDNPFRPFCSERCRLIDLGEWASESYRIPVTSSTDNNHDLDDELDVPFEEEIH
ncbi:MAG: DNA gyrase inhibitor YacG [Pseudobdellovibrionaceae bacterium]